MPCKCNYRFEWADGPGPGYTVLRRLDYATGAVLQNIDHEAALYCVAANSTYVVAGGEVGTRDESLIVRHLTGQIAFPTLQYGSVVRSVAIDADSNVYAMQEKPDTLILTTTNVGGTGSNETKTLRYGPQVAITGTFRILYGNWTTSLAAAATAAQIESALEALPAIGSGNVSCSGGPLGTGTVTIEFVNSLADTAITGFTIEQIDLGSYPTIVKYNSSGVFQWGYVGTWPLIGESLATFNQLAVDDDGNVFFGHAPRGYAPDYGCLTKLNSSGVHQWTLPASPGFDLDTAGASYVWSLDTDGDGDIYAGGILSRTTETFELELTGAPTGGTFTITVDSQTTGNIAYNAGYAAIKSALEALSNVDLATVKERPADDVRGFPGDAGNNSGSLPNALLISLYTVTSSIPTFTAYTSITSTDSLTGGSSPASVIRKISGGDGVAYDDQATFGLAKFDTDGTLVWQEETGGFNAVAVDPTDNSVFAALQDDLELRDTDGTSQWTDTDPYGDVARIAPAGSGEYYVASASRMTLYNSSQVEQWTTPGDSGGFVDCAVDGTHVWVVGNRVTVQTDP